MRLNLAKLSVILFWISVLVQITPAQSSQPLNTACELPKELKSLVEAKYPGMKVVGLSDLNQEDRELFQKDHSNTCPGLVEVDFYGDGKPTFALALTTKNRPYPRTELVLAHQGGENWDVSFLGKADGPIPVIWSDKPGKYKGVYGASIDASKPVIIFCGYSSWAVLYAWDKNRVIKIWLRD